MLYVPDQGHIMELQRCFQAARNEVTAVGMSWKDARKYSEHPVYWDSASVERIKSAASRGGILEYLTEVRALAWKMGVDWKLVDPEHEPRLVPPRV